jgi:hypothetical protein
MLFSVHIAGSSCNVPVDTCSSQPCQNSGTCVQIGVTGYQCVCTEGFRGSNCEEEEQSEYLALHRIRCVAWYNGFLLYCLLFSFFINVCHFNLYHTGMWD